MDVFTEAMNDACAGLEFTLDRIKIPSGGMTAFEVPTGSLKVFTKYVQSLLTRGKRPNQVVTKISLRKASASTSIDDSQAVFKCIRPLSPDEQTNIDAMTTQVRGFADNTRPMVSELCLLCCGVCRTNQI